MFTKTAITVFVVGFVLGQKYERASQELGLPGAARGYELLQMAALLPYALKEQIKGGITY